MPEPSSTFIAGTQAVVVGVAGLGLGFLCVTAFGRLTGADIDLVLRLGLALPAFISLSFGVMSVHIVSRGAVLASRPVTLSILAGIMVLSVAGCFRSRSQSSRGRRVPRAHLISGALLAIAALLVWCLPVFTNLPGRLGADSLYQAIDASQVLIGNSTPAGGAITGAIPNDYPWLFSSTVALVANATPGHRAFHANSSLQVILVLGAVLTAFALGRELDVGLGGSLSCAILATMSGGFGWLAARRPEVIYEVRVGDRATEYWGDLLGQRSYNASMHNLAPPLPRDLTYILMIAYMLLLFVGMRRGSVRALIGAGIVSGFMGLAGGEAFFVSLAISVAAGVAFSGDRLRRLLALSIPALALYACWALPMVLNAMRYEGFEDILADPVSLTFASILGAWGIATPLALVGLGVVLRRLRADAGMRIAGLILMVALSIVLVTSIWGDGLPSGLTTLGRPHRYWPLLYLALALVAAIGAGTLVKALVRRPWAVAVLIPIFICLALISPMFATIAYTRDIKDNDLLRSGLQGDQDSLLKIIAPSMGGDCVVASPTFLARPITAYTGSRAVFFGGPPGRQARIRWRRIDIVGFAERVADNEQLIGSSATQGALERIVARYGVDVVVLGPGIKPALALAELESELSETGHTVVWIDRSCRNRRFHPPSEPARPLSAGP